MATYRDKIEKGKIRKYFAKPRAGFHRWMKKQINRLIRREGKQIDEESTNKFKRPTKGWEF